MDKLPEIINAWLKADIPLEVRPFNELRLKITNRCPLNCVWCHNEGAGNRRNNKFNDLSWSIELENIITYLIKNLNISEIHITGGEPTFNPELPLLVKNIKKMGLIAKMTSIGANIDCIRLAIKYGLDGINFSLYSINAKDFQSSQKNRTLNWSEAYLNYLQSTITEFSESFCQVKINTIVSSSNDFNRVYDTMIWAQKRKLAIRLLPNLNNIQESLKGIIYFCDSLSAVPSKITLTKGSSDGSISFRLPSGYSFQVKITRNIYLESMCSLCSFKGSYTCSEKFYGIRLEKYFDSADHYSNYYIRMCLHNVNSFSYMPFKSFIESDQFAEIRSAIV